MATATLRLTSPTELDDLRLDDARQTSARPPATRLARLAVLAPGALMLGLGLVGLDRHSWWRDEAASLVAARRSLADLWSMLSQLETVHAVYYTLLHGWLQLGSGEVWLRLPSVLAMTVAASLVSVVGARLVSLPVGVVAGVLFTLNPSVSFYAQEARSTALVAALALLSTWFLLQAVERRAAWWPAYAAAGALLVGLNLLAVLVLAAHGLTLLWWRLPRPVLRRWAVAAAPGLLVTVVLLLVTGQQPYQMAWIPKPGVVSVQEFAHLALGPNLPVMVLMSLLVLVGLLSGETSFERRLRALALPLLGFPALALLVVSLVQPVFVPRYVFPSVAAASLLAAVGVVRLGRSAARRTNRPALAVVAAVAAVLAVTLPSIGAQRFERTAASRPDDLAGAAAVVARGARPGDAVLFLPDNRRLVALVYPGAFDGLRDVALADDPVEARNLTGRALPLSETLRNLSDSPRVWVVGRPGLALVGSETSSRAELDLLDRDFVALDRVGAHGVGITLFERLPGRS